MSEVSAAPVVAEPHEDTATLWLSRPERGNALGPDMVEALDAEIDRALAEGARLIVLRGRGRNFCTGLDLADLDTIGDGDLALRILRIEMLLQKIHALPVTTVAIAGGRVFGAGADLFAVCDHRVALRGSSFAFPGPAFGLVLGTGRLAGLVGDTAARQLLLAGGAVEAQRALDLGLATALIEEEATEGAIGAAHAAATRLDAATVAALHGRTRHADDAGDLAALARSVARPGLKARVESYRARVTAARR
ncbi:enoyl-CoA hydratase/isomerase family protein [Roseomonas eburnea]|uniref:Enoyl-CoA hydratase/isomerase family protein n=1 Tax=Neoroseomonas eburnea TaxID=1346889 RepID=A0A9X9X7L6_9PROT|nr:enoyl-CoA hydratase/isomerase family protein [Neoroseomonas eburnea]MBR0679702.1 enoyl-CoA hydratase/isomerase family protein [Neoroseomonas eburnea]